MAVADGPFCTALGCRDEATVIVIAPIGGAERPVCPDHAGDGEVVGYV